MTDTREPYRNSKGEVIPSVTEVTGTMGWNKQVLVDWANRMGLQGINTKYYVADKAGIGTLAHAIITDRMLGRVTDTSSYARSSVKQALNSVKLYVKWAKGKKIVPIQVEKRLVSEEYQYGGTCDIYAEVDGKPEVIDLKTGKGIYDEHLVQVSAYRNLLEEHGYEVRGVRVLNIPRMKGDWFCEEQVRDHEACFKAFLGCLAVYNNRQKIMDSRENFMKSNVDKMR